MLNLCLKGTRQDTLKALLTLIFYLAGQCFCCCIILRKLRFKIKLGYKNKVEDGIKAGINRMGQERQHLECGKSLSQLDQVTLQVVRERKTSTVRNSWQTLLFYKYF